MSTILIDSCEVVVTMDDAGTEIAGGSILIRDGVIVWVGKGAPPEATRDTRVIDGRGTVAIPGLINTHHHLYQSVTRMWALGQGLFGWLQESYPLWAGLDVEWMSAAAGVGLAELALSGCTTTTDHHYIFPRGVVGILEAEVDVAGEIGLRFHPCRGSMDLGKSKGGLPPDSVVEDTEAILTHTEEVVKRLHNPAPGSMLRVAIAPCSPFSVTQQLMRESAALARHLGVRLHTHVAETLDEGAYCLETFGRRPVALLEDLGWLGSDVWLAHCVHLIDEDIRRITGTKTSVAWCPTSNLYLGSGIAPARELLDANASIGLALDGSATGSGHMLAEVRQAALVARGRGGPAAMSAREALRIATCGSARCLGRDDVGSLEVGKRADIALFGVDGLPHVGADADRVAALVHCFPQHVRHLFVEGRPVVRDGHLVNVDEESIAAEGHRIGRRLAAQKAVGRRR